MLIIIEGCDGAGKSTLAREIAAAIRATDPIARVDEYHKGPPRHHPLAEYEVPLYHYRPGRGHHVICDRWHVGEAIYPEVLERATSWDVAVRRHVELFLQSRGALLVHVDPPTSVLRRRVRERGDNLIRSDQLHDLRLRYARHVRDTVLPVQRVTGVTTPFTVEKIITAARELDRTAERLNPFITYVGPPDPTYLIVGDARHELKNALLAARRVGERLRPEMTINNGPAFGPYPSTSGHFLLKHLPPDTWARTVGLANACDVDDVAALRRALGDPHTIALGVNAHRELARQRIKCGAVPHPQYWRRFFSRYGGEYATIIEQAAVYGKNMLGWRPDNAWYDGSKSTASSRKISST